MGHDHAHVHNHTHTKDMSNVNTAFIIGIVLNTLFVVIEAVAGFWTNSLGLLSDAGHNLSDVFSLILSLVAFKFSKEKSTPQYTYGFGKMTVLAALINSFILLLAIGGIGYEAIHRLLNPKPLEGGTIAIVAGIGIVVNTVTAYFFMLDKDKDLNVKGAYLHLMADALVSLGVVVAGVLIMYTDWIWLDSLISFVIMGVLLYSTWGLLSESWRLSMDGIPTTMDIEKVRDTVLKIKGVYDFHHIHIWAMSTTTNALTAHVVVENPISISEWSDLKHQIRHELLHLNIDHSTLELELQAEHCPAC